MQQRGHTGEEPLENDPRDFGEISPDAPYRVRAQHPGGTLHGLWCSILPVRHYASDGAVSGCPLHNLIPEWNDRVYRGIPGMTLLPVC